MPAKDVYRDNTYRYEFQVIGPHATTGVRGPKTGLTDLVAFMSITDGGGSGPLHTDLQATAVELTGKLGTYAVQIPKALINARLYGATGTADDSAGKTIYIVAMNADVGSSSKIKIQAKARPSG